MKKTIFAVVIAICGMMMVSQSKVAQAQQLPSAVQSLRATKVTKKSVKLKWNAPKNVSGYLVLQYDSKAKKYKKIKTTTKSTYTVKRGLKKNKKAQFMVQAYQNSGTVRLYAPCSKAVSVYALGSKKKNVKTISFMYDSIAAEEGAAFKLDTEVTPAKKVVSKKVRFLSSNPNVAEVASNGIIRTKKKGKVTITACAHNGVSSKTTIWVLDKKYLPTIHKIKKVKNLRVKALDSDSLKLQWKKCGYVDGYIVYVYNSRTNKYSTRKIVKGKKKTSTVISGLKKNVNYSFVVKGYNDKKGIHVYGANSRSVSGCVLGGSYANASSIRFGKSKYEVMEEKQLKLDCVLQPSNVISHEITYESGKEEIATVAADGTVTGHKEGKTYIKAYSHNGLSVRVPVRVIKNSKYADKISVLCFHRIVSDTLKKSKFPDYEWVAAVSDFERQMKYLYDNQYTTLSLDEFYSWYNGKRKVPAKTVVLTFDDGNYEFYHLVYPILKKYKLKATMFIIGAYTGETTEEYKDVGTSYYLGWDKINEMKTDYPNISFQSHTYNMHYAYENRPVVFAMSLAQIYQDFESNRLEGIKHKNIYQFFAYPYGGFNDDSVYCAKKYKYKLVFDFGLGRKATRSDGIYHIPRMKINGQITMEEFKKRI